MNSKIVLFTIKRLLKLCLAGVVIHLLQDRDIILMLLLGTLSTFYLIRKRKQSNYKIFYVGFFISAIGGVLAENWGIYTNRWEYHDLPNGRNFPLWLPFAWGLAYSFLHNFESFYIKNLNLTSFKSKVLLTMISSAILPTIGEIVTVKLGVWTYYNDYKIFGIPYYAIFLLMLFHTTVFFFLHFIQNNERMKNVLA